MFFSLKPIICSSARLSRSNEGRGRGDGKFYHPAARLIKGAINKSNKRRTEERSLLTEDFSPLCWNISERGQPTFLLSVTGSYQLCCCFVLLLRAPAPTSLIFLEENKRKRLEFHAGSGKNWAGRSGVLSPRTDCSLKRVSTTTTLRLRFIGFIVVPVRDLEQRSALSRRCSASCSTSETNCDFILRYF